MISLAESYDLIACNNSRKELSEIELSFYFAVSFEEKNIVNGTLTTGAIIT